MLDDFFGFTLGLLDELLPTRAHRMFGVMFLLTLASIAYMTLA
jgi:hypothetical protein